MHDQFCLRMLLLSYFPIQYGIFMQFCLGPDLLELKLGETGMDPSIGIGAKMLGVPGFKLDLAMIR